MPCADNCHQDIAANAERASRPLTGGAQDGDAAHTFGLLPGEIERPPPSECPASARMRAASTRRFCEQRPGVLADFLYFRLWNAQEFEKPLVLLWRLTLEFCVPRAFVRFAKTCGFEQRRPGRFVHDPHTRMGRFALEQPDDETLLAAQPLDLVVEFLKPVFERLDEGAARQFADPLDLLERQTGIAEGTDELELLRILLGVLAISCSQSCLRAEQTNRVIVKEGRPRQPEGLGEFSSGEHDLSVKYQAAMCGVRHRRRSQWDRRMGLCFPYPNTPEFRTDVCVRRQFIACNLATKTPENPKLQ
jgi:hypothetical protein